MQTVNQPSDNQEDLSRLLKDFQAEGLSAMEALDRAKKIQETREEIRKIETRGGKKKRKKSALKAANESLADLMRVEVQSSEKKKAILPEIDEDEMIALWENSEYMNPLIVKSEGEKPSSKKRSVPIGEPNGPEVQTEIEEGNSDEEIEPQNKEIEPVAEPYSEPGAQIEKKAISSVQSDANSMIAEQAEVKIDLNRGLNRFNDLLVNFYRTHADKPEKKEILAKAIYLKNNQVSDPHSDGVRLLNELNEAIDRLSQNLADPRTPDESFNQMVQHIESLDYNGATVLEVFKQYGFRRVLSQLESMPHDSRGRAVYDSLMKAKEEKSFYNHAVINLLNIVSEHYLSDPDKTAGIFVDWFTSEYGDQLGIDDSNDSSDAAEVEDRDDELISKPETNESIRARGLTRFNKLFVAYCKAHPDKKRDLNKAIYLHNKVLDWTHLDPEAVAFMKKLNERFDEMITFLASPRTSDEVFEMMMQEIEALQHGKLNVLILFKHLAAHWLYDEFTALSNEDNHDPKVKALYDLLELSKTKDTPLYNKVIAMLREVAGDSYLSKTKSAIKIFVDRLESEFGDSLRAIQADDSSKAEEVSNPSENENEASAVEKNELSKESTKEALSERKVEKTREMLMARPLIKDLLSRAKPKTKLNVLRRKWKAFGLPGAPHFTAVSDINRLVARACFDVTGGNGATIDRFASDLIYAKNIETSKQAQPFVDELEQLLIERLSECVTTPSEELIAVKPVENNNKLALEVDIDSIPNEGIKNAYRKLVDLEGKVKNLRFSIEIADDPFEEVAIIDSNITRTEIQVEKVTKGIKPNADKQFKELFEIFKLRLLKLRKDFTEAKESINIDEIYNQRLALGATQMDKTLKLLYSSEPEIESLIKLSEQFEAFVNGYQFDSSSPSYRMLEKIYDLKTKYQLLFSLSSGDRDLAYSYVGALNHLEVDGLTMDDLFTKHNDSESGEKKAKKKRLKKARQQKNEYNDDGGNKKRDRNQEGRKGKRRRKSRREQNQESKAFNNYSREEGGRNNKGRDRNRRRR